MEEGRKKKLLNSLNDVVRDNLIGYVSINSGLRLLQNYNIVFRHDIEEVKSSGKVTLLSGGGSGHEPFPAGFIGKGLLSAGVAGEVFTSPSPASISAALQLLSKGNTAGVLVIVLNYTGDRLNFGLAMERSKKFGCDIRMLTVAEDCALQSQDRTAGRRGLAAGTFIYKIAGAMAEEGKSLDEIYTTLQRVIQQIGTIGISLSPCSVPGSGPAFTLPSNINELGLGVHGEPGVRRIEHCEVSTLVKVMIDTMSDETSPSHLKLTKGEKIALIINNLGGTSSIEMNITSKEAIEYLEKLGLVVERAYCAPVMTSLEMAGVSLSILKLDSELISYLDAPAEAGAWPLPYLSKSGRRENPVYLYLEEETDLNSAEKGSLGPQLSPKEQVLLEQCLRAACKDLVDAEELLNTLDRSGGDADCGSTIRRGACAVSNYLDSQPDLAHPQQVAVHLSAAVEKAMGGSSGALYSLFLSGASNAFQEDCNFATWCSALFQGMRTIQTFGGAQFGDRTMLDPLGAFCLALSELPKQPKSFVELKDILRQGVEAAEKSAKDTASMKAKAGRASYVDPTLLTSPDPGAQAVAIWLRAIYNALGD